MVHPGSGLRGLEMEKRVTLAIVLCVAVFLLWQILYLPKETRKKPTGPEVEKKTSATDPAPEKKNGSESTPEPAKPAGPVETRQPVIPEKTYLVENDLYRCVVTNTGATIKSFKLKKHFDRAALKAREKEDPQHWLEILREFESGKRSLGFQVKRGKVDLVGTGWKCIRPPESMHESTRIDFEYVLPDGVKVIKEYHFRTEAYVVVMVIRFERPTLTSPESFRVEVVGPSGLIREPASFFTSFAAVDQGEYSEPLIAEFSQHQSESGWKRQSYVAGPIRYLAVSDKYFMSLLTLPPNQKGALKFIQAFSGVLVDKAGLEKDRVRLGKSAQDLLPKHQLLEVGAFYDVNFAENSRTTELQFTLYAGPRDEAEFEAAGLDAFVPLLGYSSYNMCGLSWLIMPVSAACRFFLDIFYSIVHNYGFAILLLTLLVKLCMFPLTRKQMLSMQKYQQQMAKIKPDIDRLNTKYKNNPKKKQQELMKLYKEHNMSMFPMAGCLPLLVNIPVFFGLFHALRSAMDLRHAPFIFWIKDLSAPDALIAFEKPLQIFCGFSIESLNILPFIMGVTWFTQMYFQPKPADPQAAQTQKMMMFMPIMFMFMLYNYASGLSLYWTFNSILGLIEQKIIKRGQPRPGTAIPPAGKSPTKSKNK